MPCYQRIPCLRESYTTGFLSRIVVVILCRTLGARGSIRAEVSVRPLEIEVPLIDPARTPALLLRADYNGTLAAARCLAGFGVQVTMATDSILAFARWSNSVARVEPCPSFSRGPRALAEWLIEYGRSHEKSVLYPTCDELAWVVAHYRDQLKDYFCLYSPGPDTLDTLLDKRRLYAAAAVGIATPRTWYPQGEAELTTILAEAPSVIVKPRSQTFFGSHAKGERATRLAQLRRIWNKYRASRFAPEVADSMSDVGLPMVQEYLPQTATRVVSVSGFADTSGTIIAGRGSHKVLQLPRRAGVGLCFESVDPDPQLLQLLSGLCARSGYHGVFEAEFAEHGGRLLLIDFNPRYFGQMGFDIARGMPLPWLAHLGATGREDEARQFTLRRTTAYREQVLRRQPRLEVVPRHWLAAGRSCRKRAPAVEAVAGIQARPLLRCHRFPR